MKEKKSGNGEPNRESDHKMERTFRQLLQLGQILFEFYRGDTRRYDPERDLVLIDENWFSTGQPDGSLPFTVPAEEEQDLLKESTRVCIWVGVNVNDGVMRVIEQSESYSSIKSETSDLDEFPDLLSALTSEEEGRLSDDELSMFADAISRSRKPVLA